MVPMSCRHPFYTWFTDGAGTSDRQAAKILLEEVS